MIIEKLVRKLKKQPNYEIKGNYSFREVYAIAYYRFFQIVRGLFLKIRIKESKGLTFVGRRIRIEHPYLIRAKRNLIIEDGVFINALSENGVEVGNNVNLGRNSIIICSGVIANKGVGIKIGNNTAIGSQAFLGGQGGIIIGDDVIFGPGVRVYSENHNFKRTDLPIRMQGENRKGVKIGNNCWIGSGVTILDGVTIGDGCVVAAGSIVTHSIEENRIFYNKREKASKSRLE